MQLPRGTFRSMKKGMKLETLLQELLREKFTGSCSGVCADRYLEMVFREGTILLAMCDSLSGNAAWEVIGSLQGKVGDISLSDLNPVQINLTLEFNSAFRVRRLGRVSRSNLEDRPVQGIPADRSSNDKTPLEQGKDIQHRTVREIEIFRGPAPETTPFAYERPPERKEPEPRPGQSAQKSPPSGDEVSVLHRDLEALDSMDLENMSVKIRTNCRVMIQKLHLEHLIENQGD